MDHRQHIRLALGAGWRLLESSRSLRAVDAIVFPELLDGGYAALARGQGTHRAGDEFFGRIAGASKRLATTIVAGSVRLEGAPRRATNSSLVFSRGKPVYRYDKIHLFRPTGDVRYFSPGRQAGTFSLGARGSRRRRAAVILCYDLRFPELARALALQGAEILFVPARWPAARDLAWRTLLRARAIENQLFVVGCNAPDREGGRSYVYGPAGEELLAGRRLPRSQGVRVTLDMDLLDRARGLHRALREAVVLRETTLPRWVRARAGRR
jgi:omega-amidase